MAQNKEKIIQSFIEAVKEISDKVKEADVLAKDYKAKFVALNPDLTDTNLTQDKINQINVWVQSLSNLASDSVVTMVENKNSPTHSTRALN